MNNLAGRVAVVTGVSRKNGIGFAIAKRLASMGADLFVHSFAPYDRMFPSVGEVGDPSALAKELASDGTRVLHLEADFANPQSPSHIIKNAAERLGHVDILVINHTHDTLKTLDELTAEEIDRHLSVNVRASLLLIQAFAIQHDGRPGGRIILLTSGQHLGQDASHGIRCFEGGSPSAHEQPLSLFHRKRRHGKHRQPWSDKDLRSRYGAQRGCSETDASRPLG